MRFAGPNAKVSQIEVSLGLFASGNGLEALPNLVGRGRGLQYLPSGDGVDGKRGAKIGWFNEYFPIAQELRDFVYKIAKKIALNPAEGIQGNKKLLLDMFPPTSKYLSDNDEFLKLLANPIARKNVAKALQLSENQTRNGWELGLPGMIVQILK